VPGPQGRSSTAGPIQYVLTTACPPEPWAWVPGLQGKSSTAGPIQYVLTTACPPEPWAWVPGLQGKISTAGLYSMYSPQPVPQYHGPRCEGPKRGVVLLGQNLQVIRVLPLPLCPSILKPDLDLQNRGYMRHSIERKFTKEKIVVKNLTDRVLHNYRLLATDQTLSLQETDCFLSH
jgi:hypothetical protein